MAGKPNHATRLTAGLPGGSRAAWRRCATCDRWVIAAFTDAHAVMLTPKELTRQEAVRAMQGGTLLYRVIETPLGPGFVRWQNPVFLAREMLENGGVPTHLYAKHPHRAFKEPVRRDRPSGKIQRSKPDPHPLPPPPF